MPKRRTSTALLADGAFKRLVKLTRSKGLPQWATAGACAGALSLHTGGPTGCGWRCELTAREFDALVADYRTVEGALGDIPWQYEGRVA